MNIDLENYLGNRKILIDLEESIPRCGLEKALV